MRQLVLVVVLSSACGTVDGESATTAAARSGPVFAISIGAPVVEASPLLPARTVTITGYPHQPVVVSLDRATAGVLDTTTVTLDDNGNGAVYFTACAGVASTCLGPATISVAIGNPSATVASQAFTLVYPAQVGEVTSCVTTDNVMFLHGNDFIENGTYVSSPSTAWQPWPAIDQLTFEVGAVTSPDRFVARFSLLQLPQALTPGIYDHAERESNATDGHPGLDISGRSHGCNIIAGRFQIHDYVADPVYGTLYSATISFEQACEPEPDFTGLPAMKLMVGCFHYQQAPPAPQTPPAPDPTKVSVQVDSLAFDGKPDPTARAVFMDGNGAVVLDTQVNAFGQAEAALPGGGSVTTIQHGAGSYVFLNTYRGLVTGNHVVVNAPAGKSGVMDQMLVTYTPPAGVPSQNVALITGCDSSTHITADRVAIGFYDGCRAPTFGILGVANVSGQPTQYLWNTGFTHVANTNVAMSGTWASMDTQTVTLTNVPPGLPPILTVSQLKVDAFLYGMGGGSYNGNQVLTMNRAPGAGNGTVVSSSYNPTFWTQEMRSAVDAGWPPAVTIDFAAQPVPIATAIEQTPTGLSWTQTAGTADVRQIYYRAYTSSARIHWFIREPNDGQASTTLPSLPAVYGLAPTQPYGGWVSYTDYDTVTGFALEPPTGSYRVHSVKGTMDILIYPF